MAARQTRLIRQITLLALLLLGLTALMVLLDRSEQRSTHPAQLALAQEQIERLQIDRPNQPRILIERDGDEWKLVEPWALDANRLRIEPVLKLFASATAAYSADEVDLEAAGLDAPKAALTANDLTLKIGAADLSGERHYGRIEDQVLFVPAWLLSLIDGGVTAFADLQILPQTPLAVQHEVDAVSAYAVSIEPGSLATWGELSAAQIVDWPRADMNTPQHRAAIRFAMPGDRMIDFIIEWHEGTVLLIPADQPGYAWVVDPADLPR